MVKALIRSLLSIWLVVVLSGLSLADQWMAPQIEEVFSKSREYFVRVIPGESLGDTYGFKGAAKGKYATAELYQRQEDRSYRLMKETTLSNPMAPVKTFVSNEGYWATLDNWHNIGYGKVVVFYDFEGRHIRSYKITDLFNKKEISSFSRSVSSMYWRKNPVYMNSDQKTLYVSVEGGGSFTFNLETGSYQFCEYQEKKFLCRSENKNRKWIPFHPK